MIGDNLKLAAAMMVGAVPAIAIVVGVLSYATWYTPAYEVDTQKREELFFKCLENLPAGPNQTMYNDWDEVVGECSNISYALSRSCVENCE